MTISLYKKYTHIMASFNIVIFITKRLTLNLFFQDLIIKKSPKTQDLRNDFFHNNKFFMQFKKTGKIFNKKFQRKKKEQYHLQQARKLGTPTISSNISNIRKVYKNPSHIPYFKYDRKGYYANKYPKFKEDYNVAKNKKLLIRPNLQIENTKMFICKLKE